MAIANWLGIIIKIIKEESIYLAYDRENVLSETSKEEIPRQSDTYALTEKFRVTKLRYDVILDML